jgi:hypothetical protein
MVAALDLSLVQMLRQAINTADATTAAAAGGSGNRIAASSPAHAAQQAVERTTAYRNADKPAATFSPSNSSFQVNHLHPRLNEIQPQDCDRPVMPVNDKPFIQPPWRTLPWPTVHPCCTPHYWQMKTQVNRTDISDVGRTLDLFI